MHARIPTPKTLKVLLKLFGAHTPTFTPAPPLGTALRFFLASHTPSSSSLFLTPVRMCVRAALFCMGFHWISVKGELKSPEEVPIIVAAPHSSFIDAMTLSVLGPLSGVSRIENDSMPVFGRKYSS